VCRGLRERPQTTLPHNTEDIVVGGAPRRIAVLSADGFRQALERAAAFSPETVFGDHLRFDGDKAYVPAGAACGSLACQTVDAVDVRLFAGGPRERISSTTAWPTMRPWPSSRRSRPGWNGCARAPKAMSWP
jgi:hypothetical protein